MNTVRKFVNTKRGKLPDSERVDMIANEMLLLRLFPRHQQVEEFRRNVEYARAKLPVLHALAEIILGKKMESEDRLMEHPENCHRCAGAGTFNHQGRPRFCGCPAGDKLIANRTVLPEVVPVTVVPVYQMPRRRELEIVRSLFDALEGN